MTAIGFELPDDIVAVREGVPAFAELTDLSALVATARHYLKPGWQLLNHFLQGSFKFQFALSRAGALRTGSNPATLHRSELRNTVPCLKNIVCVPDLARHTCPSYGHGMVPGNSRQTVQVLA